MPDGIGVMTALDMTHKASNSVASTPRKPYTPPRLVLYGHVKDIIQGGGGRRSDATGKPPGGRSKAFCWVAEAVYGVDDARTLLLRAWLSRVYDEKRPAWPLIALYKRFGRAAANLIRRGYLSRGMFRLLFDALVRRAIDEWAYALVAARE
jgi:hypothetical protein